MSEDDFKRIFSANLRHYMDVTGKTQLDIINDLGFDKSAVSTWVKGTRLPRMDKVNALARYFGVKRSDLIEEKAAESGIPDDVAVMAERLHKDPDLRMLFSLAEDARPEDLQYCADLLRRFKEGSR